MTSWLGHAYGLEGRTADAGRVLQAGKRRPRINEVIEVPIWLLHGNGLGNLNWELRYDPEVVRPEPGVAKGNLLGAGTAFESAARFSDVPRPRGNGA